MAATPDPWAVLTGSVTPPAWRGPSRVHVLSDDGDVITPSARRGRPPRVPQWQAWSLLTPGTAAERVVLTTVYEWRRPG